MNDSSDPPTGDSVPSPERPNGSDGSSSAPTPAEHTQPLPPYQQPTSERASAPARRNVVTGAVLAGALLVGGAAGVGGAAWYDAWNGGDTASTSSTAPSNGAITADNTSGPSGSVEQVAAKVLPSVVEIDVTGSTESGSGSGIVLTKYGEVLTNNHVAAVAGKTGSITVHLSNGVSKRASIIGNDPLTDVALLKVHGVHNLKPATIGRSSDLKVGQNVVAFGAPYGLSSTVTSGIVSALHRPVSVPTSEQSPQQQSPFGSNPLDPFGGSQPQAPAASQETTYPAIQTDAAINPGNSGGPLVNMSGQVVGIDSSIYSPSDATTGQSGSVGLGFAIPMDEVIPIVNQIHNHQAPTHARLGVTVSDTVGKSLLQGARVRSVEPNGVAKGAGLQPGDVITKVDNIRISGADALVATIRGHRPGDNVKITYVRGGSTHTTSVSLGSDAAAKNS